MHLCLVRYKQINSCIWVPYYLSYLICGISFLGHVWPKLETLKKKKTKLETIFHVGTKFQSYTNHLLCKMSKLLQFCLSLIIERIGKRIIFLHLCYACIFITWTYPLSFSWCYLIDQPSQSNDTILGEKQWQIASGHGSRQNSCRMWHH